MQIVIQNKGEKGKHMNKQKIKKKENALSKYQIREEFGTELTSDMNAAKIYDVLASTKQKKK